MRRDSAGVVGEGQRRLRWLAKGPERVFIRYANELDPGRRTTTVAVGPSQPLDLPSLPRGQLRRSRGCGRWRLHSKDDRPELVGGGRSGGNGWPANPPPHNNESA